jgi:predicted RNA polymerase sigma factor
VEGSSLIEDALRRGSPGYYSVLAAIAALHDEAPSSGATDWPQIGALYDVLRQIAPSPAVELNRAVAIAMVQGPDHGLAILDVLSDDHRLAAHHRSTPSAHIFLQCAAITPRLQPSLTPQH